MAKRLVNASRTRSLSVLMPSKSVPTPLRSGSISPKYGSLPSKPGSLPSEPRSLPSKPGSLPLEPVRCPPGAPAFAAPGSVVKYLRAVLAFSSFKKPRKHSSIRSHILSCEHFSTIRSRSPGSIVFPTGLAGLHRIAITERGPEV